MHVIESYMEMDRRSREILVKYCYLSLVKDNSALGEFLGSSALTNV